jgi:peroxiredoxin
MTKITQALLIIFLMPVLLTAQSGQADSTLIDVRIEGLGAGLTRLVGVLGDQNYIADSVMVDANGAFTLRRKAPLPAGYYTFLLPGMKNFAVLIDVDQHFSLRANVANIVGTMKVDGSLDNELLYQNLQFQQAQEPELNRLGEIMRRSAAGTPEFEQTRKRQLELLEERKEHLEAMYKAYPDAFFTKFKIAGQNPDFVDFRKPNGDIDTIRQVVDYRNRFWEGVDFSDERLLRTPVISNKLRRYIKDLTPQHRDSLLIVSDDIIRRVLPHKEYFKFFANWIAIQYENGKTTVMDGEAVFVHIIQNFFTPELAFWETKENLAKIQKHVGEMEASLLWKKGPDVKAPNQYGEFKSIYDMTADLIVIFMYSPHCEHCQEQSPVIQQLYEKWKGKGVDFYGIAVSTTDEEWKAYLKKTGFTFTNVFDPTNRAIYAKYYVDNTPEVYVLNKDRIIIAKNLNANQLETIFEREMKK